MKKQQAQAIETEMYRAGYKPILAQAARNGMPKTWEVWGVDPATGKKVMITSREQWDQRKAQEVQP